MRGPALDVIPRYLKHPVGGAGWSPDGAPLDSGTAMIVHNNASVISEQNCRLLGHTLAPGLVIETGWASALEGSPDPSGFGMIPWRQDISAVVIGPFAPSHTRVGVDPPGLYPRRVRVITEITKNAPFPVDSTLTLMAALTRGYGTPLTTTVLARATTALTGGAHPGDRVVSMMLDIARPIGSSTAWRSRPGGTLISTSTPVSDLRVWLGWASTDVADAVWAVSAFEVPE